MNGCLKFRGWRAPVIFSIFFVLLSVSAFRTVSASDKDDAWRSIQRAEQAVSSAFEAVSDAESAGADVSGLIVELNRSVGFLSEANILFRNGDFGGAARLADLSVGIVEGVDRWELDGSVMRSVRYEGVRVEASRLKASALSHRDFLFKVSLVASILGVPVFLLFMLFLWRWFKEFYARRLLDLKPEVASDVEP